jgi:predicted transcriptional regulator
MKQPFVICIRNDDYPASLEKRKLYVKLPDTEAEKHHHVRVIDESGEDYLYPEAYFVAVKLTDEIRQAIITEAEGVKKPPIPLKDIVKERYVVCLECGKKMRTLKAHLGKAHNLTPNEYFKLYGLDEKKYPLVCKEYSKARRKLAIDKGLGAKGGRRKATA